jgi:homopolymeric O-antigen transport system ATP-binding protein
MDSSAIRAIGLGKSFRFFENKWFQLRSLLLQSGNHSKEFWAVRNVNLDLPAGTTLGIIGQNGSGKTTLLQLLAGLLKPSEGNVEVRGNLATLLDLQGGFNYELTGRENIFVSCGLRGFSKRDVEKRISDIIDFAELQKFIDQPIKHYSTGMLMRLAFATAINVQPDVLLIDEVFAVGDMAFQHKCAQRFRELQSKGTTIVLATHDMTAVKSLCHHALLLVQGEVARYGNPEEVTNCYLSVIAEQIAKADAGQHTQKQERPTSQRHGTFEAKIIRAEVLVNDSPAEIVLFGEEAIFRFHIEYFADVSESILGFYIRDRYGNDLIGINTHEENRPIGPRKKGDRLAIEFKMRLFLREGSYSVSPGLAYDPTEPRYLDWINNAAFFQMGPSGKRIHGFIWIPNEIIINEQQ